LVRPEGLSGGSGGSLGGFPIGERVAPLGVGWPNIVTGARVLLAPILVVLILARTRPASYAAAAVFLAGGFSDGLDGYLARRHGMATRTGAWLDPLSDKLLIAAPI